MCRSSFCNGCCRLCRAICRGVVGGASAVVPADLLKKAKMVLTRMNERSVVIGRVVKRAVGRVGYV